MPCPVCTHTMQGLGNGWFWCPRCGTLGSNHAAHDAPEVPSLVKRSTDLCCAVGALLSDVVFLNYVRKLGDKPLVVARLSRDVAESIGEEHDFTELITEFMKGTEHHESANDESNG